jgi:hypothetical protein
MPKNNTGKAQAATIFASCSAALNEQHGQARARSIGQRIEPLG